MSSTLKTMPGDICVNGKFFSASVTGVQRYGREIVQRCPEFTILRPPLGYSVLERNLWEQVTLPGLARHRVLWSPANSGPLIARAHVITIHDVAFLRNPRWFSNKFAAWYSFLLPLLSKNALRLITVSEFSRGELCECLDIPDSAVSVIYNGADHILGVSASRPNSLTGSERFVLSVGSVQPRKNFRVLLDAWVKAKVRRTRLVVVGEREECFAAFNMERHEGIVWTGRLVDEHLRWLYENAAAYVAPSLYEGFDLPSVEAISCGAPVVASDIAVHREVLQKSAIYFDPVKSEELTDILVALDRNDFGLRRPGPLEPRFTWDACASTTAKLLAECSRALNLEAL